MVYFIISLWQWIGHHEHRLPILSTGMQMKSLEPFLKMWKMDKNVSKHPESQQNGA